MRIAIIGTCYVGFPTGVGFAELGHDVVCIDNDQSKIDKLNSGAVTLYEAGLEELFSKNFNSGQIKFTTSMKDGVKGADIVMIAVGTPPHPLTKEADMKYVHEAAAELGGYLADYTVVAVKSTVPVGTGDDIEALITKKNPKADFDVISLPEFLREGYAVYDFFNPDRIVVGANSKRPLSLVNELYTPFKGKSEILHVNRRSSETIKYASNAFLAMKIHYINEMANFCEKVGADVLEVAKGMGMDTRIGNRFLIPGPGFGGSCFPKDTLAMVEMGRKHGVNLSLIETTIKGNDERKVEMANKILDMVEGVNEPMVAVLGLAFKEGTDDCRKSPSMEIVAELLDKNIRIKAYDPKAMETAKELVGDRIEYASNVYDLFAGADVIAVLTEWKEFKEIDLEKVAKMVKNKNIVDCRNIIDKEKALNLGFTYKGVGR